MHRVGRRGNQICSRALAGTRSGWRNALWPWPDLAGPIEPRLQDGDEQFLPAGRGKFTRAFVPFDTRYLLQQANHPPRQPFGVGHAIRSEALAKVLCLADIQDTFGRAAEEIKTGSLRQASKECLAETVHQRARIRQQPELFGSHRASL